MYSRRKAVTEQLYCGMYIDEDGFAMCLIDTLAFRTQGFKVDDVLFLENIHFGNINNLVAKIENTKNVIRFGINKPFRKEIINSRNTIQDLDFDLFNGMILMKSMINEGNLKIDRNTEIYELLKNYEKDTTNHQVFSLLMGVSLIESNISTLRYWDYWANYKAEPIMES